MLDYWVQFAETGNPNSAGQVAWSQFQSATDCYLEIKATPDGSHCGLRTAQSNLWDDIIGFTGCTSSVGLETISDDTDVLFYPNPTKDIFTIKLPNEHFDSEVTVYSSVGQKVYFGKNVNQINLSSMKKGLYFIEINAEGTTFNQKIIKNE